MLDLQGIVGTTASAVAILAGILALIDRWASRRQLPPPTPLTSPSGLILLTRPLPPPRRPRSLIVLHRAARILLVLMAWFVSFVAGVNLFGLTVALLAPLVPRVAQAAATTDMEVAAMAPIDVLAMLIVTTFLSLFLLTTSGWPRRGALIAVALGFLVPNGDFWLALLR